MINPGRTRRPLSERFWEKVDRLDPDECWEWQACRNSNGYGRMHSGRRKGEAVLAHRASWELHNGSIPDGLFVCHKCDNPACVNPEHLWLGTQADNNWDMFSKGRCNGGCGPGEQNGQSRLTNEQVITIRARYANGGTTHQELCDEYGVSIRTIGHVITRKSWKHI